MGPVGTTNRASSARRSWVTLAACSGAVALVALIGGFAARDARSTYQSLELPSWAPPGWVFGPVWGFLYITIALAGWLALRRDGWSAALGAYAAQLVLNAVWTPLFFGADRFGWALVDIVVLWALIAATIVLFWRVSRYAASLLVPYWGWVTFATVLTWSVLRLN